MTPRFAHLARSGAAAVIANLFDRAYADPGAEEHRQPVIGQDGRVVRMKLAWRF